ERRHDGRQPVVEDLPAGGIGPLNRAGGGGRSQGAGFRATAGEWGEWGEGQARRVRRKGDEMAMVIDTDAALRLRRGEECLMDNRFYKPRRLGRC
ncbi:MAG: hypothetical protein OEY03_07365, partial [Rhizobacter sp.]|nr:hypothetical protein [Rhizobacter sp.]